VWCTQAPQYVVLGCPRKFFIFNSPKCDAVRRLIINEMRFWKIIKRAKQKARLIV